MSESRLDELMFLYAAAALDDAEREEVEERLASGDPDAQDSFARAEEALARLPLALEPRLPDRAVGERLIERARAEVVAAAQSPEIVRATRPSGWLVAAGILLTLGVAWSAWRIQRSDNEVHDALVQAEAAARALATVSQQRADELARDRDGASQRAAALASDAEALRARNRELRSDAERKATALAAAEASARAAEARAAALSAAAAVLEARLATTETLAPASTRRGVPDEELGARLTETERALALVRAPDSALIELVAEGAGERGSASVFWDRGLRHCYLHVRSLAPTVEPRTYALWIEYASGRQVRITDFGVSSDRSEVDAFADLPVGLGEIARTWVTRESQAGAAAPTGPTVLRERRVQNEEGAPLEPGPRRYRRRGA